MDRKKFLRSAAALGLSVPLLSMKDVTNEPSNNDLLNAASCDAMPEETAGPYPVPDSVSTSSLVRSDITESIQTGIPLTLTLTVVNTDNECLPVSGLRVDIWHCNKRGYYSAYDDQPGIDGTVNNSGETWLRGIQYTDSNGMVTFTTIYPGWYTPRATHIHVQVFDSSNNLITTTQLAFPDEINTTVNNYYATSGTSSYTNQNDMVFSDSYESELMTVSGNTTDGYTADKELAISAGEIVGVEDIELETGGQFSKLTCYPNPCTSYTKLSFNLLQTSKVKIKVMDVAGKLLNTIEKENVYSGLNQIQVNTESLNSGIYFIQLEVSNHSGTFRQSKKIIRK